MRHNPKSILLFFHLIKDLLLCPLKILSVTDADFVLIHREIAPVGPPILEWLCSKVLKRKIVFDFDDAIWLTDKSNESSFERKLRYRTKVAQICRWSNKVSAGNEYLAAYARQFSKAVVVNPTTIDTENFHNPAVYWGVKREKNSIIIGWTGSHSTLKYLKTLEGLLRIVQEKYSNTSILVVADRRPTMDIPRMSFRHWTRSSEIQDLMEIDIGIMPLPDDSWTKGKCGFKALQFMALEIPVLVSPVGANKDIVQDGVEGFWCNSDQEWLDNLEKLIENGDLRTRMGKSGRKRVVQHYSIASNERNFLSLFDL